MHFLADTRGLVQADHSVHAQSDIQAVAETDIFHAAHADILQIGHVDRLGLRLADAHRPVFLNVILGILVDRL